MGRKSNPNTDDLLSGRARPVADALLRAIYEQNPTDRGLSRKEMERRYARKAQLQSLLINHHGAALVVERDSADERIVLLRHRSIDSPGTHARIDTLDDDARAFVRAALDRGGPDAEPAMAAVAEHPRRGREAPLTELGAARAAIAEYDLDGARAILSAHIEHDGEDVEAASLLVELLVDHLGLDADALGLPLQAAPARDRRIRARLAVAGARVALSEGRYADVARALKVDDLELVADSVAAVRADLAKRIGEKRREAEASLQQTVSSLPPADRIAAARGLLAIHPDSDVGRRIVRDAESALASSASVAAIAAAEEAYARGDDGHAAALLRRALPHAVDRAAIESRLVALERTIADRERDARVAHVAATFAGTVTEPGIAAYLALNDDCRRRLRAMVAVEALEWAEALLARGLPPRAIVSALVALWRATLDPGAAAAIVPHAPVLDALAPAQRILARLEEDKRTGRAARAHAAVASARSAMEDGRADEALRRLSAIPLVDLAPAAADERAALLGQIELRQERERLIAMFHANVDSTFFAAREAVEALATRHPADPTLPLTEWQDRVEQNIARAFGFADQRVAVPIEQLPWVVETFGSEDVTRCVADIDGRPHVLHLHVHGMFLCVFVIDADRQTIVRQMTMRAPLPFSDREFTWDGAVLRVLGSRGALTVDTDRGRVLGWTGVGGDPAQLRIDDAFLTHDGQYAWLQSQRAGHASGFDILNLVNERGIRRLAGWHARAIAGSPPLVQIDTDGGSTICDARGQVVERWQGRMFNAIARLPSERGWVHSRSAPNGEAGDVELWIRRGQHDSVRAIRLPGTDGTRRSCLFAAGERMAFAYFDADATVLSYFRDDGDTLHLDGELHVPDALDVYTDGSGLRALSLWSTVEGARVVDLAGEVPAPTETIALPLPSVRSLTCTRSPFEIAEQALADADIVACHAALDAVDARVVANEDRAHLFHLRALAALYEGDHERATRATAECAALDPILCPFHVLARFPHDPDVAAFLAAIADADAALDAGDPQRALAALDVRVVHRARELQSQARIAAAWLELGDTSIRPTFAQFHALAAFVASQADKFSKESLLPGRRWPAAKLRALAKRSIAWLAVGDPFYVPSVG